MVLVTAVLLIHLLVVTLLAGPLLAVPACASLVPMSWGFPQMIQNNSLTSFQNMFAWQNEFEDTDISFPTVSTSVLGIGAFPQITQLSNKAQVMSNVNYMHQQETSVFSYPWISIGFSPVPSMGFL